MWQLWADQHEEEPTQPFYVSPRNKPRQCQNPPCGHKPIFNIWVMRHEVSGEVKEIGTHCHQRWKRLRGYGTDPWFNEYESNLIQFGKFRPGQRLTSAEMKTIRKDSRRKWIIKQVKKKKIPPLRRMDMPLQNFKTREQADKWAFEHGGYVSGTFFRWEEVPKTVQVNERRSRMDDYPSLGSLGEVKNRYVEKVQKQYWIIYINPKYKKGDY